MRTFTSIVRLRAKNTPPDLRPMPCLLPRTESFDFAYCGSAYLRTEAASPIEAVKQTFPYPRLWDVYSLEYTYINVMRVPTTVHPSGWLYVRPWGYGANRRKGLTLHVLYYPKTGVPQPAAGGKVDLSQYDIVWRHHRWLHTYDEPRELLPLLLSHQCPDEVPRPLQPGDVLQIGIQLNLYTGSGWMQMKPLRPEQIERDPEEYVPGPAKPRVPAPWEEAYDAWANEQKEHAPAVATPFAVGRIYRLRPNPALYQPARYVRILGHEAVVGAEGDTAIWTDAELLTWGTPISWETLHADQLLEPLTEREEHRLELGLADPSLAPELADLGAERDYWNSHLEDIYWYPNRHVMTRLTEHKGRPEPEALQRNLKGWNNDSGKKPLYRRYWRKLWETEQQIVVLEQRWLRGLPAVDVPPLPKIPA